MNVTLEHGDISGNAASSNGGGFYIDNCRALIDRYLFSGNQANISGGGIYVTSAQLKMHNTKAHGNRAGEQGGFLLVVGDSRSFHFIHYFRHSTHSFGSCITAMNIELGQNHAKTGSNIAVVNGSSATLEKLHRPHIEPGIICPMVVEGRSLMNIVSLYHTNHSADTQNNGTTNNTTDTNNKTIATVVIDDTQSEEDPDASLDADVYHHAMHRERFDRYDDWPFSRYKPEMDENNGKDQDIHACRDGSSQLLGNITSG